MKMRHFASKCYDTNTMLIGRLFTTHTIVPTVLCTLFAITINGYNIQATDTDGVSLDNYVRLTPPGGEI